MLQPPSYYWVVWQMVCLSIMCGLLLSMPTRLESLTVYYSHCHLNTWAKQTCSSCIPHCSLSGSAKWGQSWPLEWRVWWGMMGRFQYKSRSDPWEKQKKKQKTKHTPHTCFIYIFIYIFHIQSYIPNPRDSNNRNKYWNNYIAKWAFCS